MGASPALAATRVIESVDSPASRFVPDDVTIEVGDTIRWEFDQAATLHNVKNVSANWSISEERGPGGAPIERTFDSAGTYTFLCDIHTGMTGSITVEEPALENVLVFSRTGGFRHDSIDEGITAIQELGTANGFTVTPTEDPAAFTDTNLATFDVVVFLSTTGEVLNDAQQARLRALHPGRRRLRRHPRGLRHRVHVAVVRRAGRRLLPQPPAGNAGRRRRHRGR